MRNTTLFFNLVALQTAFLMIAFLKGANGQAPASSFEVEGIKVIYKPTFKQIVNVSVYFRGGVENYPPEKAGIERLAVRGAVECGSRKFEKNRFKDQADLLGIEIRGVAGLDESHISLNCISKYFNEGWDMLTSALTSPLFEKKAFENMRQGMLGSLREAQSNPDSRLRRIALQNAFAGTPYATDPDGTEAGLGALSMEEVRDYYFKTLQDKARIFIVVVGNVPVDEIRTKISAAFASLPVSGYRQVIPATPVFTGNRVQVEERAIATNYIYGIMNAPAYVSPDYVPFLLACSELHGMLFTEIRIRRNLSYAPDAGLHASLMPYSNVYVSTRDPKEAVKVMSASIEKERDTKLVSEALQQIKALYITGSYVRQQSSDAIAEGLGLAEVLGGWELFEKLPGLVSQATSEEIAAAFRRFVGGIVWTYLGDKQKADEASESFMIKVN